MARVEKFIIRFESFAVLVSLGFYVWFLRRFGLGQIYGYLKLAAWGLCLTITLESISRILNTIGWRVTIPDYPRGLGLGELFAARIAGEAIDYVTPTAQLGGQPVMATMVRRRLRMAVGLATVSIAALTEAIGQIGFITAALVIAIPLVVRVHSLLWPLVGGMVLAVSLAGGFFYVQTKRPFERLRRAASGLMPLLNDPELRDAAAQADAVLADFYAHHRVRLAMSSLCYLIAWSMGPVEIYILLRLLHQPVPLLVPLAVEAVGLLIERATFLIPAKLVSQEGGKALILALLGYPAGVGFVVGLLRRIKEMAWVLFGLSAFAIHRLVIQREAQEAGAPEARSAAVLRAQGEQSL